MKQPMQPLVITPDRLIRFHANAIVRWMLEQGREGKRFDMNLIAMQDFSVEDQMQFAQLIGYSLSGYADLSYVTDESYEEASVAAEPLRSELATGKR